MRSPMLITGGAVLIAAIAACLLVVFKPHGEVGQPLPATEPAASAAAVAAAGPSAPGATSAVAATSSNAFQTAPGEPGLFAGFAHWSAHQRTVAIAGVMAKPDLDLDVVAFLDRELDDRALDPASRNDVANALIAQDRHDPALAARLLAMVDEPAESPAWRDYALQHAARALAFSDHAPEALARLVAIATRPTDRSAPPVAEDAGDAPASSLRGTALIQLDHLDRDAHVAGSGGVVDAGIAELLADARAIPVERRTAVGLAAARGLRSAAPRLRTMLAQDADPATLRVCLAALGTIGDRSDASLLRSYLAHPHPLVALAAKSALARLPHDDAPAGG